MSSSPAPAIQGDMLNEGNGKRKRTRASVLKDDSVSTSQPNPKGRRTDNDRLHGDTASPHRGFLADEERAGQAPGNSGKGEAGEPAKAKQNGKDQAKASGKKAASAFGEVKEEEASTSPLPEKCQVDGSPLYIVERQLGKGGFGQVYVGRKADMITGSSQSSDDTGGAEYMALKFEHRSSKGCKYGPPYEWTVYDCLDSMPGVPRVYYKGEKEHLAQPQIPYFLFCAEFSSQHLCPCASALALNPNPSLRGGSSCLRPVLRLFLEP